MIPIHKFNNGNGATLCNVCSQIISIGHVDSLLCKNCHPDNFANKRDEWINFVLGKNGYINDEQLEFSKKLSN